MAVKDIKNLKAELYGALLKKSNDELTDTEIEIMFHLSSDEDVHAILDEALRPKE